MYMYIGYIHDNFNMITFFFIRSGANLEVANHVMIIHPYCPPGVTSVGVVPLAQAQAFEQQAVGRVLRYPQSKPVHVYRFYSMGTPEEELYTHWGWVGLKE